MILGTVTPLGGDSPTVVLEVDEHGTEQSGQLIGDEGLSDTALAGMAYGDRRHMQHHNAIAP